ncbi:MULTISPECIES: WXG100 family type VII secretion target [Bacillus]|uniref:WXG100 family type VII secretion target n=1 Tax=Bacillus TaxID=1386 RepID=UPI000AC78DD9|nr:WXG100 family type VII secretion target [Bacillus sp. UNC322MFChir4.1]
MGQVRVDPDKLEEAADSISRNRESMEKVIQELLQVTFELQISWEGMARKQFFDEFFSKKKSMDDLVKHLKHTELELKKSAKTFREADEKAFDDFNQMDKLWDAFQRGSGRAAEDTIFDPLKKAWNQTSDFFGHLVDDPKGTFEDAKYGLRDFVESSIDEKKEEFKDTYEFIGDLWNDPIGTLKYEWDEEIQKIYDMRNVLSDWYVKNVEYGDAESYTEAIAYGATTLAIAAVLTKGAGAVGNGARWGKNLSSMSEFQLGSRLEPAYIGNSYLRRPDMDSLAKDTFQYSMVGIGKEFSHLKNLENFKVGTKENGLNHVFQGEVTKKGKAVGFHYEGAEESKGKIIGEVEGPNEQGIYQANVNIDGKLKNAKSTFFPKDWTEQQVIDSINEAFNNKELYKGNRYIGTDSNGIKIEMQIKNGKITSAYPLYKP